jgi:hypothetical protein
VVWNFLEHVQANVPEGELRRTVGMLRQR